MKVTPLYAAICAVMLVGLGGRIARMRGKYRVGLGTGTEPILERAIRVHGNFIENVPIALILLALAELQGLPAWGLHALGVSLVVARVFHAQGLNASSGTSFGRFVGTSLSWLAILVNAALCAYLALL